MITVVDLNLVRCEMPLISEVLVAKMQKNLSEGKKVLLTLNRRGAMSTLVCRDCGWAARCPSCDLLMRVHHNPQNFLLCHLCENQWRIPDACPKCNGNHLVESWSRVQSIDASIRKLFPNTGILLVEKDANTVTQKSLKECDILIGTQKITSLPVENIWLTAFLLVESDLSVPTYNIEEEVYSQVKYFLSKSEEVILQTRSPKLRLIQDLVSSNFRTFFQRTIAERKQFNLPPFVQMVVIHIGEASESTLKSRMATLASAMIETAKQSPTIAITYDHLLSDRRQGKYYQKILIKWPDVLGFLEPFRKQLVRGRDIEVEWL